jgi:preprotein translocase subunit SecE
VIEEVGAMEKVLDFIRESKAELKKVTWPTLKQIRVSTFVVIALTVVVGIYLFLVDFALSALVTTFLG